MSARVLRGIISVMVALMAASCAMTEKSTQLEDTGALVILGEPDGATLQVDDASPVAIKKSGPGTEYAIEQGTRRIRIQRGGTLLVDRLLFFARGQTVEVKIL